MFNKFYFETSHYILLIKLGFIIAQIHIICLQFLICDNNNTINPWVNIYFQFSFWRN